MPKVVGFAGMIIKKEGKGLLPKLFPSIPSLLTNLN